MLGAGNLYEGDEDSDFEDDEEDYDDNDKMEFEKEAKRTLERCIKNKFSIANAVMEIKNLKMTFNMDYSDCIEASYPVLLGTINEMEGSDTLPARVKNLQGLLTEWKLFLKDLVREEPDQFTLIRSTEIFVA